MPRKKEADHFYHESRTAAREIIRHLHPTVPPRTSDVEAVAQIVRQFTRLRLIQIFQDMADRIRST